MQHASKLTNENNRDTQVAMPRPIALTLGEPAGIGPDLAIAVWRRRFALDLPPFYVLADPEFFAQRAKLTGPPIVPGASAPAEASTMFATALPIVDIGMAVTRLPRSASASATC
jgi:4-hydroxythreonine-4-phosphate dehydrogenase